MALDVATLIVILVVCVYIEEFFEFCRHLLLFSVCFAELLIEALSKLILRLSLTLLGLHVSTL